MRRMGVWEYGGTGLYSHTPIRPYIFALYTKGVSCTLETVAILGAGAWGLTLAMLLHERGHAVRVWGYHVPYIEQLRCDRENRIGLPGVRIPDEIALLTDVEEAVSGATLIILPGPSDRFRERVRLIAGLRLASDSVFLSVAKGIETGSLMRMSEILLQQLPDRHHKNLAVLSGPSIAREVVQQHPTTVVVASPHHQIAERVQWALRTPYFRIYTSSDVTGVELGGALKNVIAIAAGICDGLNFGANAKGALLTRGLAEITRLGRALGAQAATFAGLSGMGDLLTTCMSPESRNRYVGECIGRGQTLRSIQREMVMVAEGITTAQSAAGLAARCGIDMPITREVCAVLFEEKAPLRAVSDLMMRDARAEQEE